VIIFVDASALIAIIIGEPNADPLADALEAATTRLCSPLSVWETVAGLCRSYRYVPGDAWALVARYRRTGDIRLVPMGERESELAHQAYGTFGKGRHPAALNMGDCFAYACARTNDAALLFTGRDFQKTDILAAVA
jgi:ribonuclease VapC